MRIAFTGGGTGGHLTPIVAVAREIKRIAEEERIVDVALFYFGPESHTPDSIKSEEIVFSHVAAGKMRNYFSLSNFFDLFKTFFGIIAALWKLFIALPDVVFSKGGYGSFPVLVAARIYGIPVIIHESDAVPGRVNTWAGRWARRIAVSFPSSAKFFPQERTALTGVPIRKRILASSNIDQAREIFGVFSARPVIFVTGGSQGAEIINQTIAQVLKELAKKYEIIHQAGEKNFEDVRLETSQIVNGGGGAAYYHLLPFLDESQMRAAYTLADLVISRAGATSIFEIAARGKPSIIIPIKDSAQDHQRKNAYEYGAKGAADVIESDNLTPSVLLNEIERLMTNPEQLKSMSQAAQKFARLDAAEVVAHEILKLGLH